MIAETPSPPYFAVIFTSIRAENDAAYDDMSHKMVELAKHQAGFLGVESARNGLGITVSYWSDLKSIQAWKRNIEHRQAQALGKAKWYRAYKIRISRVERNYGFDSDTEANDSRDGQDTSSQ